MVLTVAGAAGLIMGGFMNWIHGMNGVDLSARAFYQRTFVHDGYFVTTAGFAMIVLWLLALVGLEQPSDAFGVVLVHLAAEGADEIAAHACESSRRAPTKDGGALLLGDRRRIRTGRCGHDHSCAEEPADQRHDAAGQADPRPGVDRAREGHVRP